MKNIISLLIIFFCVANSTFSQIEFGIIAGPNYSIAQFIDKNSSFSSNNTEKQNFLLGIHAGVLLSSKFNDRFSMEANILYNQKGYRFRDMYSEASGKVLLHNINLPIVMGYQISKKMTIQLGPEIGYLVSPKIKILLINQDFPNFYDRNFSLAGLTGINYAFTDHLELGLRYIHGVTQINQKKITILTDDNGTALGTVNIKVKSRVLQLSMRYRI